MKSIYQALGAMGLVLALGGAVAPAQAATFTVKYEAPGVQNSTATFSSSGIETFDSRAVGSGQTFSSDFGGSSVVSGNYTGVDIRAADVFGGSGGNTNFASTVARAGYSLDLTTTDPNGINYFGFWLSALDTGNNVRFYKGGVLQFSFNPGDVVTLLAGKPGYQGNPNAPFTGGNSAQQYVFLNFFDESGTFDQVRFFEAPEVGGYESDNHTVGFFLTRGGGTTIGAPEPSTWAMMLLGFGGLGATLRRRRSQLA